MDSFGCIMTPNYDGPRGTTYQNNVGCTIEVTRKCAIEVEDFNVEAGYDILKIRDQQYSGASSPHGVVLEEQTVIEWTSDYSITMTGFKICHKTPPPCPQ